MISKRERKPSVFSFDGFPNIELLDQCRNETPLLANDGQSRDLQHQEDQQQQKCQQISASTSLHQGNSMNEQKQSVSTNDSIATKSSPSNNIDDFKATPILQPKPIRQDIMGSNGSSRASSCDEPTIALNSTSSSIIASPNSILSSASLLSSDENFVNQQGINFIVVDDREEVSNATNSTHKGTRKGSTGSQITLSALSDSASLSCSSDSLNVCSKNDTKNVAPELATINVDNTTTITTNDSCKTTPPMTPTLVAPFESIRTQIKRNSIPNAQLVRRHIDNLISQNTAVVDNWNLVSIRSYTSSSRQDQQANNTISSSSSPAVTTTITATKPTNSTIITGVSDQIDFADKEQQQQLDATSSSGASKEKLLSFPLTSTNATHLSSLGNNKRPKRWSTAMMSQNQLATLKAESSSNFGYSKALNNCNYINNNFCDTNNIGDNNYLATSLNLCDNNKHRFSTKVEDKTLRLQQATNFRPLKQSERKRSYNLARLSSPPTSYTYDSLHASGSHLNSPLITPCSSTQSLGGANLTSSSNPSMSTSPSIAAQQQQQANNWPFSDQIQGIINKLQLNTTNNLSENNLFQQYQDPLYIENGIQNLSLRRRESINSEQLHHHPLNPHSAMSDEQLINSQPLLLAYHNHHHHHSSQIDHQPNLIPPINQYHNKLHHQQQQQQQEAQQSSGHDQIVMAALIMERHRQSLIAAELHRQQLQKDIENQAAIIRQKQMIEQQMELQIALTQQLAASLKRNQQSEQQYCQPVATSIATTSLATNISDTNFDAINRDSSFEANNTSETTLVRQSSLTSNLSILKQQLFDMQQANIQSIQLPVPHESLPFKKRKISEPNIRY